MYKLGKVIEMVFYGYRSQRQMLSFSVNWLFKILLNVWLPHQVLRKDCAGPRIEAIKLELCFWASYYAEWQRQAEFYTYTIQMR